MPWFGFISRRRSRLFAHGEVASSERSRQLTDARQALTHAAELASLLEKEIRSRQATLEAIEADIAANRVLASIEQRQAASLVQLVDTVTRAAHQRMLRANRIDQIGLFLAGVIASTVVQLVASWL